MRLQEMMFGRKSEKRKKANPESTKNENEEKNDTAGDTDSDAVKDQAGIESDKDSENKVGEKRRGHGRIPAAAYVGAKKVHCRHTELTSGSVCPDPKCRGKVYPVK